MAPPGPCAARRGSWPLGVPPERSAVQATALGPCNECPPALSCAFHLPCATTMPPRCRPHRLACTERRSPPLPSALRSQPHCHARLRASWHAPARLPAPRLYPASPPTTEGRPCTPACSAAPDTPLVGCQPAHTCLIGCMFSHWFSSPPKFIPARHILPAFSLSAPLLPAGSVGGRPLALQTM